MVASVSPVEVADYCSRVIRETVDSNPWIPVAPTLHQARFLSSWEREVLYGGAAGGGKSVALLAAALQYVDVPGYSALLLRRTYPDLAQAGGLIDLSKQWLRGTAARWNEQQKRWTFPSGAMVAFGYCDHTDDVFRYQGGGYMFVAFDELTQFEERAYLYLFSRLRRVAGMPVPIRMRAASNPGGIGHQWVKRRFITGRARDRRFIPAKRTDNPHLDQAEYAQSLARLDAVTRRQLEDGDWDVARTGGVFDPDCLAWQEQWIQPGETGSLVVEEAA